MILLKETIQNYSGILYYTGLISIQKMQYIYIYIYIHTHIYIHIYTHTHTNVKLKNH